MARRFGFLGREAPNAQLNYAILPSFCLDYKFHVLNNSNHSCSILLFLSARERKKNISLPDGIFLWLIFIKISYQE